MFCGAIIGREGGMAGLVAVTDKAEMNFKC